MTVFTPTPSKADQLNPGVVIWWHLTTHAVKSCKAEFNFHSAIDQFKASRTAEKIGSGDVADNLKSIFTAAPCFIITPDTAFIIALNHWPDSGENTIFKDLLTSGSKN